MPENTADMRANAERPDSANGSYSVNQDTVLPFGWLAYLGTGLSVLVCYGKVIILGAISTAGVSDPEFNPHFQAILMWALGIVALYGLYRDRRAHGRDYPLVLGTVGVVTIVVTLYTHYSFILEVSGYVMLIVAALLNQNVRLLQLNSAVEGQAKELSQKAGDLEELNNTLEQHVADQVKEIESLARLKRFLAPEVARIVTEEKQESLLESHRAYIVALFCDIRGFTSFAENMEPEEVMNVLQSYHEHMGKWVATYGGTIDHRSGDGLMVFFNDPLPSDDPVMKAVEMALNMRATFNELNLDWSRQGYQLGFGVGIASGYATLGIVGFEGRYDYTANGNVVNLASRLCDEAKDGEILISRKAYIEVEDRIEAETAGERQFKGFARPVTVYNVKRSGK